VYFSTYPSGPIPTVSWCRSGSSSLLSRSASGSRCQSEGACSSAACSALPRATGNNLAARVT